MNQESQLPAPSKETIVSDGANAAGRVVEKPQLSPAMADANTASRADAITRYQEVKENPQIDPRTGMVVTPFDIEARNKLREQSPGVGDHRLAA